MKPIPEIEPIEARPVFRWLGGLLAVVAACILVLVIRQLLRPDASVATTYSTWTASFSAMALLTLGGVVAWRGRIGSGWILGWVLAIFALAKVTGALDGFGLFR